MSSTLRKVPRTVCVLSGIATTLGKNSSDAKKERLVEHYLKSGNQIFASFKICLYLDDRLIWDFFGTKPGNSTKNRKCHCFATAPTARLHRRVFIIIYQDASRLGKSTQLISLLGILYAALSNIRHQWAFFTQNKHKRDCSPKVLPAGAAAAAFAEELCTGDHSLRAFLTAISRFLKSSPSCPLPVASETGTQK
ncbi:hypothetical protein KIL84_003423, partial [Mauremys mutica]